MGRSLQDYSLKTLREAIAYIPQNNVIISGTVEENLRLGCQTSLTSKAIEQAVQVTCCWEWISQLSNGYAHRLDEGGLTLSGGQRQTLALARALLQQKPIIILDESLSAVSKLNVQRILAKIKTSYPHQTILLVTHEKEIIDQCDSCIAL